MNALNGVCIKCGFKMGWMFEAYGNACNCARCGHPVQALKPIRESVMKKTIELTENEIKVLRLCVSGDYKIYIDRAGHAASHGQEYVDNYGEALGLILEKLND